MQQVGAFLRRGRRLGEPPPERPRARHALEQSVQVARDSMEPGALGQFALDIRDERVCRVAGRLALGRRRKVTSVDKANVLDTSRLWRDVATRVFRTEFPEVAVEHLLVDAAAMHLLSRPADFDVMVTENMFGDILTDEASMLAGSMGMLPSASLGDGTSPGLYEPIHGSAPDIAGQGVANPCGTILSAAMLLRYSCKAEAAAAAIEAAVAGAVRSGARTRDIAAPGARDWLGTTAFTDAVLRHFTGH